MARIVVCEDDPVILKLLQVSLRDTGYELLVAHDGVEGLALIERERPDAILTDVTMPRMSGTELASAVRERADLAHIPVVFLSASAQRGLREPGNGHGPTAYVSKPFRTAELRDALAWVLDGDVSA
ncbi:MAG: response regulator [Chloroflexi bacterium]|nr:response regulator [Chloroflexota bacterium]